MQEKTTHHAAIIRGDGIGPELCEATVKVIETTGVSVRWQEAPIGLSARETLGESLPLASLEKVKKARVALKAPLIAEKMSGGIRIEDEQGVRHYPSINNAIRRELTTYANLRPIQGWKGVSGRYEAMNIIIVREVSEGIYIGIERQVDEHTGETIKRTTRRASERIGTFGFEYARKWGRKKVTVGHKANVLHQTDGLFLSSMRDVAARFPDTAFDDLMIDAACYHVIKTPQMFDVIVLPNQYGDIFSDITAGLAGSMGLAPGANIGDEVAFFEASHGAAPDIAGQGIVNPISLILSGALMLEHLNETAAADRIRKAVGRALENPNNHTPDLGGRATTKALTEAICYYVEHD